MKTIIITVTLSILILLLTFEASAQPSADINKKNDEKEIIRKSKIKSKSIWEYRYAAGNEEALADSGYKAFNFDYDQNGRITDYIKYHIFSDLTVREVYRYNKTDYIDESVRYNSAGDMIETINYKYNSAWKPKKEIHTAYYNGIRPGVYFSILANTGDDELFNKLQNDLEIDPKLESYTITVNISDPDEENQYIVIGDESDPTSPRYSWSQLTMASQRGLLSYQGPNRKEHTYISKNIANVIYKHDKAGNMTERDVYNTSNDLIEKETFRYDANDHGTGYTKYNENGKASSMESYTYDDKGRLAETVGQDPDGKIASRLSFKYDDNGNMNEKTWFNTTGEINSRYKYTFDDQNRLIDETKFRAENEKEYRQVYKYDANGNILEIVKYDTNDKKEKLTKYVYEVY
jgi:hypothetical protein